MAEYYAKLNENNQVVDHNVVSEDLVVTEGEQAGSILLAELFGGTWVRFSKDGEFRGNKAQRGFVYDETLDAFIPPQPYSSWELDTTTFSWKPPIPYPTDGGVYEWNEETTSWDLLVTES